MLVKLMVVFESPAELVDECGQFAVGAVSDKGAECLFPVVKFTTRNVVLKKFWSKSLKWSKYIMAISN